MFFLLSFLVFHFLSLTLPLSLRYIFLIWCSISVASLANMLIFSLSPTLFRYLSFSSVTSLYMLSFPYLSFSVNVYVLKCSHVPERRHSIKLRDHSGFFCSLGVNFFSFSNFHLKLLPNLTTSRRGRLDT